MNARFQIDFAIVALVVVFGLSGCGPSSSPAGGTGTNGATVSEKPETPTGTLGGKVDIDGSSTVFPVKSQGSRFSSARQKLRG